MPLRRVAEPFDDPDWRFELKYDGFRALAYLNEGRCRLVSRNGNQFKSFTSLSEELGRALPVNAVLDGEIVCLDSNV
jgi:bifunctional non-homologous end joining protein LigD